MDNSINRQLLPYSIKRSLMIFWVCILPQIILLLINLRSFWLISDEVSQDKIHIATLIFIYEIGLLVFALIAWWFSRIRKTPVNWGWNLIFLLSHIGYLWYVTLNFGQLIPSNIEPWILDEGNLIRYQFTFIMPGLFYAGLILACFEVKLRARSDFGLSLLITVLAVVLFYVIFIGIIDGGGTLPAVIATLFFVVLTVLTFVGLIRVIVLSYNIIRSKGHLAQILFAVFIGLIGPIAGLLLNKTIPFPADFQSPWVYILAVINGLILLIPSIKIVNRHGYLLFARSLMYPFTFYFFLVFLPFLPLSLPAIFAVGTGFLILVPVVLFLLHTKKLFEDIKICTQTNGIVLAMVLSLLGLAVLPGYFTFEALRDKASLRGALRYAYSPDYRQDLRFKGSVKSVRRTLINLKQFKEGIQLPYLTGLYNKIVFEGMVLPDKKIEYMYRLFTGEELSELNIRPMRGFGRFRGAWRRGVRVPTINRQVALVSLALQSNTEGDITKSRITLEMHNNGGSNTAEFVSELHIPKGVLITDFRLKVGEEMIPGQIFEKRTAMWVYHMIRDFTRRDPGILTYTSPTQVNLNVYPFAVNETRRAEIEFQFPNQFTPAIFIGKKLVKLTQGMDEIKIPPIITVKSSDNDTIVVLPEEQIAALPKLKRQPYFHFILDFSERSKMDMEDYVERIFSIAKQYGHVKNCKITAANFNIEELTSDFISLNNKDLLTDILKKTMLPHQGSLDLARTIKHHLVQYQGEINFLDVSKPLYWKQYPLFVVITNDKDNVLNLTDMEFFKPYLPDCDYYLISFQMGHLEERPLWAIPGKEKNEKVIIFQFWGNRIAVIPGDTNEIQTIFLDGNFLGRPPSVYDPNLDEFKPLNNFKNFSKDSPYAQGMDLMLDNYEILMNPAKFDTDLPSVVNRSRESRVMIPSTSYTIVERRSQWKILKVKEKQRLGTSEGLEFEEDFDTPAPSIWVLLAFITVWWWIKNKKYGDEFKNNPKFIKGLIRI